MKWCNIKIEEVKMLILCENILQQKWNDSKYSGVKIIVVFELKKERKNDFSPLNMFDLTEEKMLVWVAGTRYICCVGETSALIIWEYHQTHNQGYSRCVWWWWQILRTEVLCVMCLSEYSVLTTTLPANNFVSQ